MFCGERIDGQQSLPLAARLRGARAAPRFRHGNVVALAEQAHRVDPFHALDFLDEFDHIPALAASETVEDLFRRADGKGWRFFAVERAQSLKVQPSAAKLNIALDNTRNVNLAS